MRARVLAFLMMAFAVMPAAHSLGMRRPHLASSWKAAAQGGRVEAAQQNLTWQKQPGKDILRRRGLPVARRNASPAAVLTQRIHASFGVLILSLTWAQPAFASTQGLARMRWTPYATKVLSITFAYVAFSMKNEGPNPGRQGKTGIKCPWPFVMFHDPIVGLRDWPTWASLSLLLWKI